MGAGSLGLGVGVPAEEPESSDQPEPDLLDVVANALAGSATSAYDLTVNTLGQAISVTTPASASSGFSGDPWVVPGLRACYNILIMSSLLTCIANVSCESSKSPTNAVRNAKSEGYANLSKQEKQILDAVLTHWKTEDLVAEAMDYWKVRMYVWKGSEDPVYLGLWGASMTHDSTNDERMAYAHLYILSDAFKINIHGGNAAYSYDMGRNDNKIVGGRLIVD